MTFLVVFWTLVIYVVMGMVCTIPFDALMYKLFGYTSEPIDDYRNWKHSRSDRMRSERLGDFTSSKSYAEDERSHAISTLYSWGHIAACVIWPVTLALVILVAVCYYPYRLLGVLSKLPNIISSIKGV